MRENKATARTQAMARSPRVRRTRTVWPKRSRTAAAPTNKPSTEQRRGLHSQARLNWPQSSHNTLRVKPQVGQGMWVSLLKRQSCKGRSTCVSSQTAILPSANQTKTRNTAQLGHWGRRETRITSISIWVSLDLLRECCSGAREQCYKQPYAHSHNDQDYANHPADPARLGQSSP